MAASMALISLFCGFSHAEFKPGRTYYEVLEVTPEANKSQLTNAYKKLIKEYHPDSRGGDRSMESKLLLVIEAWNTLKDQKARKLYDLRINRNRVYDESNIPQPETSVNLFDINDSMAREFSKTLYTVLKGSVAERTEVILMGLRSGLLEVVDKVSVHDPRLIPHHAIFDSGRRWFGWMINSCRNRITKPKFYFGLEDLVLYEAVYRAEVSWLYSIRALSEEHFHRDLGTVESNLDKDRADAENLAATRPDSQSHFAGFNRELQEGLMASWQAAVNRLSAIDRIEAFMNEAAEADSKSGAFEGNSYLRISCEQSVI